MNNSSYSIVAVFMALLLHAALVVGLVVGLDHSYQAHPAVPLAIKATLVSEIPEVVPPPADDPPPEPEVVEPEVVEPETVEPDPSEQARIAAEEEKRRQDALIEQQRLEEIRKREEEAEQRRIAEEEEKRRKAAEEEARRKRELEKEMERRRIQAAQDRERDIQRQREENERQRRAAEEAQRASEIAAEEALLQARNSREMDAYVYAIQQKVIRNWIRPASARAGLLCEVKVRQTSAGDVMSVSVLSCNGDAAVERSIVAAVNKASPLPLPSNALLFDPDLRFNFKPEQ